jgi:hypothetical protein
MANAINAISLVFAFVRETPKTFVFGEVDAKGNVLETADAISGSIYLKKSAVGGKAPKKLRVTIEAEGVTAAKPAKASPAKAETKTATPAKADAKKATVVVKGGKKPTAKAA